MIRADYKPPTAKPRPQWQGWHFIAWPALACIFAYSLIGGI